MKPERVYEIEQIIKRARYVPYSREQVDMRYYFRIIKDMTDLTEECLFEATTLARNLDASRSHVDDLSKPKPFNSLKTRYKQWRSENPYSWKEKNFWIGLYREP